MSNSKSKPMPLLFVGHGNPMHAIEPSTFTHMLNELGQRIPNPKAIVCFSAHWMTPEFTITKMSLPKTIHDFQGFPRELYDIQYSAPGNPALAERICEKVKAPYIKEDSNSWGLDHGTWAILKHMYPKADIPILQISICPEKNAQDHFDLGEKLKFLRDEGVLLVGSGNIVHNLRTLRWGENVESYQWADEFDRWVRTKILARDFSSLINDYHKFESGRLSVPTLDHYLPLLPILGASDPSDKICFEYQDIELGSISMTSFSLGL